MYRSQDIDRLEPPFPALTPAQRYHLEVNGYVVVEGVLGQEEVDSYHDGPPEAQAGVLHHRRPLERHYPPLHDLWPNPSLGRPEGPVRQLP